MSGLSDTHFHFTDPPYISCPDQVFSRLIDHNIQNVLVPAYSLQSCRQIEKLQTLYPELPVAIGIHPRYLTSDLSITRELPIFLDLVNVSAIGEIGLDNRPGSPAKEIQESSFYEQLHLAAQWNLPIIIHCVKAHHRCVAMLKSFFRTSQLEGVIHRISCSREIAGDYLDLGLHAGFGPDLFDTRRHHLHALARWVPDDRILLETDAPYGKHPDGHLCHPWDLRTVLAHLASLRNISADDLESKIIRNTFNLFGI
jgi:TatD DNase family protein